MVVCMGCVGCVWGVVRICGVYTMHGGLVGDRRVCIDDRQNVGCTMHDV